MKRKRDDAKYQKLVGERISVYWEDDDAWYKATVLAYDSGDRRCSIMYDDDDVEVIDLDNEKYRRDPSKRPYILAGPLLSPPEIFVENEYCIVLSKGLLYPSKVVTVKFLDESLDRNDPMSYKYLVNFKGWGNKYNEWTTPSLMKKIPNNVSVNWVYTPPRPSTPISCSSAPIIINNNIENVNNNNIVDENMDININKPQELPEHPIPSSVPSFANTDVVNPVSSNVDNPPLVDMINNVVVQVPVLQEEVENEEDFMEVELNLKVPLSKLGIIIKMATLSNKTLVGDIYEGSPAQKTDLRVGDEIIEINDHSIVDNTELSRDIMENFFRESQSGSACHASTVRLKVKRSPQHFQIPIINNVLGIRLHVDNGKLLIQHVVPNSGASIRGIKEGHELLAVNNMVPGDGSLLSFERELGRIKKELPPHGFITMTTRPPIKSVSFIKSCAGVDIILEQRENKVVVIKHCQVGGIAYRNGIRKGDIVLRIDNYLTDSYLLSEIRKNFCKRYMLSITVRNEREAEIFSIPIFRSINLPHYRLRLATSNISNTASGITILRADPFSNIYPGDFLLAVEDTDVTKMDVSSVLSYLEELSLTKYFITVKVERPSTRKISLPNSGIGLGAVIKKMKVTEIFQGTVSDIAGLVEGDKVLSIDGVEVKNEGEICNYLASRRGEHVKMKVKRKIAKVAETDKFPISVQAFRLAHQVCCRLIDISSSLLKESSSDYCYVLPMLSSVELAYNSSSSIDNKFSVIIVAPCLSTNTNLVIELVAVILSLSHAFPSVELCLLFNSLSDSNLFSRIFGASYFSCSSSLVLGDINLVKCFISYVQLTISHPCLCVLQIIQSSTSSLQNVEFDDKFLSRLPPTTSYYCFCKEKSFDQSFLNPAIENVLALSSRFIFTLPQVIIEEEGKMEEEIEEEKEKVNEAVKEESKDTIEVEKENKEENEELQIQLVDIKTTIENSKKTLTKRMNVDSVSCLFLHRREKERKENETIKKMKI